MSITEMLSWCHTSHSHVMPMPIYNIPSIKRMVYYLRLDLPTAKLARKVMEARDISELETMFGVCNPDSEHADKFPCTRIWYRACYGRPGITLVKMYMLNDLLEGHGVKCQSAGTNAKSPQFEYVNMGDTYDMTIMYIYGRGFKVSDWGTIVERGNYQ